MSAAFVEAARARAPNYVEAASRRSCAASSLGSCPRRGGPASSGLLVLLCVKVLDASRWTRCDVCDAGAALRGRGAIDFSPAHSGKQSPSPASAWPVWPATCSRLIHPEPSGLSWTVCELGWGSKILKTRGFFFFVVVVSRARGIKICLIHCLRICKAVILAYQPAAVALDCCTRHTTSTHCPA